MSKKEKGCGEMFCKECGQEIPAGEKVCPSCGAIRDGAVFCKHCGAPIDADCVVCPKCGKQVKELKNESKATAETPQIVINNSNVNTNTNVNKTVGNGPKPKNKWVAFLLCLFLGFIGAHKFYEGKILLGIVYIFTGGLFFIGWLIDLISLLFKPNPYYV